MTVADPGPDLELLADLDAGLLDPERAAAVRAAALADPRSAAVLDALGATRAELAALTPPPIPADAAASWAAALAAAPPPLSATPGPETPPSETPPSETPPSAALPSVPPASPAGAGTPPPVPPAVRRLRPAPHRARVLGLLAAAAAVVALVAGALAVAAPDRTAVARVELIAVARSTVGLDDLGPLDDPERRAQCLARLGATGDLAGGLPVRLDGTPGVLLVLTTGRLGSFRVVVVDDACSTVLADTLVV